jgi:hypothetical protein
MWLIGPVVSVAASQLTTNTDRKHPQKEEPRNGQGVLSSAAALKDLSALLPTLSRVQVVQVLKDHPFVLRTFLRLVAPRTSYEPS